MNCNKDDITIHIIHDYNQKCIFKTYTIHITHDYDQKCIFKLQGSPVAKTRTESDIITTTIPENTTKCQ